MQKRTLMAIGQNGSKKPLSKLPVLWLKVIFGKYYLSDKTIKAGLVAVVYKFLAEIWHREDSNALKFLEKIISYVIFSIRCLKTI